MDEKLNIAQLGHLNNIPVNHGNGLKKVFKSNDELNNLLTQIAYGIFHPGESCDLHHHPTMDEYFFFIKGKGEYNIEDSKVKLEPGTFLEIKSGMEHKLVNTGTSNLEFVYWGISKG